MSALIKIVTGLLCLAMGLGFIYRFDLIERVNAFLRETVLNDAHLALERRRWGFFFLLSAFLFLYMGLTSLGRP
ncbi:MAG: hypothetical protein PHF00_10910 [Elusimicrobia bacterium]|nr:hypothetical protein [Elusimicrobiota bacterium]